MFSGLGKSLIFVGAFIIIIGVVVLFSDRIPYLGKLPGDIYIKKGNFQFYFPLATSVVISIALTLIYYLITHIFRR
jgi:hypothetical protein